MTNAEIIERLGGTGALATDLGMSQSAVSNWVHRGVPWRLRHAVAERAAAMKVELPVGFLVHEGRN